MYTGIHKHGGGGTSETVEHYILAWLSSGEIPQYMIQTFSQLMSPEQMTFDLYGHAANPPLNGKNVGVTLTLSLEAVTKWILRCLQVADMEN